MLKKIWQGIIDFIAGVSILSLVVGLLWCVSKGSIYILEKIGLPIPFFENEYMFRFFFGLVAAVAGIFIVVLAIALCLGVSGFSKDFIKYMKSE